MLHGARVGLVGVIGRSARRIDSAGVATQAQGIILTVSFVDSAGPRAASPCRFPAQARAGAGSSGPDATFLLGNRFDVRARCAVPASASQTRSAAHSAPIPRWWFAPAAPSCRGSRFDSSCRAPRHGGPPLLLRGVGLALSTLTASPAPPSPTPTPRRRDAATSSTADAADADVVALACVTVTVAAPPIDAADADAAPTTLAVATAAAAVAATAVAATAAAVATAPVAAADANAPPPAPYPVPVPLVPMSPLPLP